MLYLRLNENNAHENFCLPSNSIILLRLKIPILCNLWAGLHPWALIIFHCLNRTEYGNSLACIFPEKCRIVEFALMRVNTAQRFFKNFHLRKTPIVNLAEIFWKTMWDTSNYIQIPQAYWPEVVVIWASFHWQKIEVHIFERTNRSIFRTWKFNLKEDLNPRKQVFFS